ncbi:ANTAR domain-containing protein [Actinosynnema sp. CS-041913]|uniref:ANTAR domain-containing protein n=1 Tax=Actinosynnema sp. CS-041913 TaxID=3239917 RepID=UPI003D94755A
MSEPTTTEVWARLRALARQEGEPVSVRHACVVCALVLDARGAGLSMTRDGGVCEPVFATDEHSRAMDELQFTVGEGPNLDAVAWGSPVLVADLLDPAVAVRWPVFTPAAARLGARSVIAMPVRSAAAEFGVLTCYRDRPGLPGAAAVSAAFVCADAVLVLALDGRGGVSPSLTDLLDTGFAAHGARVHQAAGMVSVQLGVDITDALVRLRAHAFARDRPLSEVAAEVLSRRLRFAGDGTGGPPDAWCFPVPRAGNVPREPNEEGGDR